MQAALCAEEARLLQELSLHYDAPKGMPLVLEACLLAAAHCRAAASSASREDAARLTALVAELHDTFRDVEDDLNRTNSVAMAEMTMTMSRALRKTDAPAISYSAMAGEIRAEVARLQRAREDRRPARPRDAGRDEFISAELQHLFTKAPEESPRHEQLIAAVEALGPAEDGEQEAAARQALEATNLTWVEVPAVDEMDRLAVRYAEMEVHNAAARERNRDGLADAMLNNKVFCEEAIWEAPPRLPNEEKAE